MEVNTGGRGPSFFLQGVEAVRPKTVKEIEVSCLAYCYIESLVCVSYSSLQRYVYDKILVREHILISGSAIWRD